MLEGYAPSCLALDTSVENMESLELQRCLAVDRPTMPIIFVTREADVSKAVRAMKAGALEFLLKQLHDAELQSGMTRAIATSNVPATYVGMCHLLIRNFTDRTPVVQITEVVLENSATH